MKIKKDLPCTNEIIKWATEKASKDIIPPKCVREGKVKKKKV